MMCSALIILTTPSAGFLDSIIRFYFVYVSELSMPVFVK